MLPLKCSVQNYEWGKEAQFSEVAKIARANGSEIDSSKPFAELWMGTHPKGPSVVASTGANLQAWIEEHPESLGAAVKSRFGTALPFLLKILSVNKALSIQSHPDKDLAQILHRENPKMYADDNHKPEMALAISHFEALCGFAPLLEIQRALLSVPELCMALGESNVDAVLSLAEPSKEVLKTAFTALMVCSPVTVESCVRSLVARLQKAGAASESRRDAIIVASPTVAGLEKRSVASVVPGMDNWTARAAASMSNDVAAVKEVEQEAVAVEGGEGSADTRGRVSAGVPVYAMALAMRVSKEKQWSTHTAEAGKGSAAESEASEESEVTAESGDLSDPESFESEESQDPTPTTNKSNMAKAPPVSELSPKEQLVLRLDSQFPSDVGILSAFFLNFVTLEPGEAIYLAANEPHAYLKGEIVECMATSDNVIRAGLTPKFKHTEVLCESLSYGQGLPNILKGIRHELPQPSGSESSGGVMLTYRPPFDEFEVHCVQVPAGCSSSLPVSQGPLILLVLSGSGSAHASSGAVASSSKQLHGNGQQRHGQGHGLQQEAEIQRGSIMFVPALTQLSFDASAHSADLEKNSMGALPLTVWVASVNSSFFGS